MHITLISFLLSQLYFFFGESQSILPIPLNGALNGTTIGAETGIFLNFSKKDIADPPIGTGGQRFFELIIPSESGQTDLQISTCVGSDFDTYIALLDGNPINSSDISVVAESGNDLSCKTGRSKGFLSTKVNSGTYFVAITGRSANEGVFNISIIGSKATPIPVPWGLDRIDQRKLPLNGLYEVQKSGDDVWVYIIDSGIRASHEEFEGRAEEGYDFVNYEKDSAFDCTGHGTHIAGIIAGKTFGVSRKSHIAAVRAFGCDNQAKSSALIDAIGWILVDSKIKGRENIVVTLMLSTSNKDSTILGTTIRGLSRAGIPVIVPAGNNAGNACDFYPGSIHEFFTVGSTDPNDDLSSFSNAGNCTSIYGPGTSITSSWHTSDNAWRNMSGTAQAAAHVVGIVANFVSLNNNVKAGVVKNVVESISSRNIVGDVPSNETTRFGYVRSVPKFMGIPPSRAKVYLFAVLGIPSRLCGQDSRDLSSLRKSISELLSVKVSRVTAECTSSRKKVRQRESKNVQLRIELPERLAAATFNILENALVVKRKKTEDMLGYSVDVVELPWAVDSTPIVYWGAPSFATTESNSLSAGAIAGAVVGACCLVAILATVGWIIYLKMRRVDAIESMEGSADFEKDPVHFDDYKDTDGTNDAPRSFRNVVKAMKRMGRGGSFYRNNQGEHEGMNKMGSFIGSRHASAPKDMVRLDSVGGEAFARLADFSKGESSAGKGVFEGSSSGSLALSFRGLNNLVLKRGQRDLNTDDSLEPSASLSDGSLMMRSFGGEAFAKIGHGSSRDLGMDPIVHGPGHASTPSHEPQREASAGPGAVGTSGPNSDEESQRTVSFFGGIVPNAR